MTLFNDRRRQQFITEPFFQAMWKFYGESKDFWSKTTPQADSQAQGESIAAARIADDCYSLLSLNYTAGEPIEPLRDALEDVIVAYEHYATLLRRYEDEPEYPIFGFQYIDGFERIAQLLGLAFLLHRRDLIPRIHALIAGSAYDGVDAMYEELVSHVLPDRPYLDCWYHHKPYIHLLNATDYDDPAERTEALKHYCEDWFPAMQAAPWHNSHLRMTETDGDYFGYWAFEAGAIALLYDIDDSTIDHMVYPKDLVDWARQQGRPAQPAAPETKPDILTALPGQPCPESGDWFAHQLPGKTVRVEKGQPMPGPEFSSTGQVIWHLRRG